MKSLLLAAVLGVGSLGLIGLTPGKADASWLSEWLRQRYDPGYYSYSPPVDYYSTSTYVYPNYGYSYSVPSYPYSYGWYRPYRYGHWYGGHRGWNGGHWHGGHGRHHR